MRKKALGIVLACISLASVAYCLNPFRSKHSQRDTVGFFKLDPHQPFQIQLGRGSGWHGLDIVIVDETGHTTMSRQPMRNGETWMTTDFTLAVPLIEEIVGQVNKNRLTGLDRAYSANVHDGTQWIFYATQGGKTKVVYFDNNFPRAIEQFASKLDDILHRGGQDSATWTAGGEDLNMKLWDLNK